MSTDAPTIDPRDLSRLADTMAAALRDTRHRAGLVVAGSAGWTLDAAAALLTGWAAGDVLWLSARAPKGVAAVDNTHAREILGREFDAVVVDAHTGFDPDAFGAVSGTLKGGGLLLLLTPPLAQWPDYADPERARITVAGWPEAAVGGRFLARLVRVIRESPGVGVVEEGAPPPPHGRGREEALNVAGKGDGASPQPPPQVAEEPAARTPDQAAAVAALIHVVTGQRRRPVVLTADRGRGKSSALGIAAARLLERGVRRIIVTGPSLEAAAPVFHHAHRLLPHATGARAAVHLDDRAIRFMAPDALVRQMPAADLVLVDEAATIPVPLLRRMLDQYPRIAFATTVHGYEGTGRAFSVRFASVLERHTRGWRAVALHTPIRWAEGDPVEAFTYRALLLDAEAAEPPAVAAATPADCVIERLDRAALARDEARLCQLYGLLVQAHYRTRPYDLRYLLDGPNLAVWAMRHAGQVVATALVAEEGGFDADTAHGVWAGRIRPHGHLLPECLAAQVGLEDAPGLRHARVMRIAVHPTLQGRGLGTALMRAVTRQAERDGMDCIGSSFGATAPLLGFWRACGLLPVRVSVKRGATSGAHSALVLRGLTGPGAALARRARDRCERYLGDQLLDPLRDLEPEIVLAWLVDDPPPVPALDTDDWRDVAAFAFGGRPYEVTVGPVRRLVYAALHDRAVQAQLRRELGGVLVVRVLQARSWSDAAAWAGLSGRAQVMESLRVAVAQLVRRFAPEEIQRLADALARG